MVDGSWVAVAVAIGVVIFLAISANRRGRPPGGRPNDPRADHGSAAGSAFLVGAVVAGAGYDDRQPDPDGGAGSGSGDSGSSHGGSWGGGDGGSSGGGSWGGGDGGGGDGGGGGGGD